MPNAKRWFYSQSFHGNADYAASFGLPETTEGVCINCGHPFKKHEGWSQHGASLRCPIVMADTLIGFSDSSKWSFGHTRKMV